MGAYICDDNWVTYMRGVYLGGIYTGGVLTVCYGMLMYVVNFTQTKFIDPNLSSIPLADKGSVTASLFNKDNENFVM